MEQTPISLVHESLDLVKGQHWLWAAICGSLRTMKSSPDAFSACIHAVNSHMTVCGYLQNMVLCLAPRLKNTVFNLQQKLTPRTWCGKLLLFRRGCTQCALGNDAQFTRCSGSGIIVLTIGNTYFPLNDF